MKRIFIEPKRIQDNKIKLSAQDAKFICPPVSDPAETFIICDGESTDYVCRLDAAQACGGTHGGEMFAQIISRRKARTEPSVECFVYVAYAQGKQLDYAVQKSVELGAHEIVVYDSGRCVAERKSMQKAVERLQKTARKAAARSGRGIIPPVCAADDFKCVTDAAADSKDLAILLYENEENLNIRTVLEHYFPSNIHFPEPREKVHTIAIITGPDDGFEPSEVKLAQSKGISAISLGPRLLHSETAPIVALSAIMYHTGNI